MEELLFLRLLLLHVPAIHKKKLSLEELEANKEDLTKKSVAYR